MSLELIKAVKGYPILYDISLIQYRDLDQKNSVWEEIAQQLNESEVSREANNTILLCADVCGDSSSGRSQVAGLLSTEGKPTSVVVVACAATGVFGRKYDFERDRSARVLDEARLLTIAHGTWIYGVASMGAWNAVAVAALGACGARVAGVVVLPSDGPLNSCSMLESYACNMKLWKSHRHFFTPLATSPKPHFTGGSR
ncbi:unnamed protein product [Leptidea sinapis]|uniref:MADF domain-containing protein n=1 Tax=Leptidea sinapis TaxID=189913 RepID=A0A5E4R2C0_9NEOP|nr:unnamed protein product [Leptidea sinapis]